MSGTVTIPRELAERFRNQLYDFSCEPFCGDARRLVDALDAVLAAPSQPLTAEECRAFAERLTAIGEHGTAWHVLYTADHLRPPLDKGWLLESDA